MSRSRLVLLLTAVAAIAVGVLLSRGDGTRSDAPKAEARAEGRPAADDGARGPDEAPTPALAPAPALAPGASAPAPPPVEHRDRDRVAWSAAREKIESALERRRSSPAEAVPATEVEPPGTLSKEYIRERVREDMLPLVQECYEGLLERHPTTGGRMILKFAIMGDEDVGGIVDGVELAEESEIQDVDFRECLTESTMSAVFDPPEGGGRVEITYPFIFSVEPDAETPTPG